jgi:Fe-S cluster assembly ATP-binding protein
MSKAILEIKNLTVWVEGKVILKNFTLEVQEGQMHALMGRNGSGKTTLGHVLMGHPAYSVSQGQILFQGQDLIPLSPDERAKLGIFVAFQYPVSLPGVTVAGFLRESMKAIHGEEAVKKGFRAKVKTRLKELGISEDFMTRSLNEGFSGGEKKRMEVLQLALLEPKLAILDEVDSGLDIDSLKILAEAIKRMRTGNRTFLLITHYHKMIDVFMPDKVHVLYQGEVVASGNNEMARHLDQVGYENFYSAIEKGALGKGSPSSFGRGTHG